jgi:hypothetical protein
VKQILTISASALILMTLVSMNVAEAQTRVTGHVFAEVVETIGMASNTSNRASLPHDMSGSEFDLGEVSINAGSMGAYAIVIETSDMVGDSGKRVSFDARTENGKLVSNLDQNGKQVLRLSGSAKEEIYFAGEKNFSAAYNITFAYN